MSTSEIDRIYHLIAEHSGDVIWVLDISTIQFSYVSSPVYQLLGYTPEELLKQKLTNVLTPDSARFILENFSNRLEMLRKADFSSRIMNHEVDHLHSDGSIIPAKVFTGFITDEVGNVTNILGVSRKIIENTNVDQQIIEEKLLQRQKEDLIKALHNAEESDRLKTVFLQNVAHEIRTPMNAIMGFSDLLVANFGNKSKLEYYTSIIRQRGQDLLDLVNDMLDLSKIEAGEQPVLIGKVDVDLIIKELNDFFQDYKKMKGKEAVKIIFYPLVNVSNTILKTDKGKLRQIFINLISNALKYTTSGSIEIGCNLNQEILHCYVSDTGIGIPEEQQPLIFNRFLQLNNRVNSSPGGTGLGLAIVKGLVELLGGEIKVQSTVGRGSTFSFTIKSQQENIQGSFAPISVSSRIDTRQALKKSVLVVEDDIENAAYLMDLLSVTGLLVHHVAFDTEVMDVIHHHKIDLLLMNICLPEMGDIELIKRIKGEFPDMKIIAQTASNFPEDKTQVLRSDCEDVITRPIQKSQLYSKLGSVFR